VLDGDVVVVLVEEGVVEVVEVTVLVGVTVEEEDNGATELVALTTELVALTAELVVPVDVADEVVVVVPPDDGAETR